MLFAMVMIDDKIDDDKQMYLCCRPFQWPCGHIEVMHVALPDTQIQQIQGHTRFPWKLATTRSVPPRRPPGLKSTKQQSNNRPTLLAVSMVTAMQQYNTACIV